jgi:predicted RNA-binding Zn-ribbon protein involved in translation (DUF1610 family)
MLKLVTLRTFSDSIAAHLLKTRLESEGIECYLVNEHISNLHPFYNQAVGGVQLQVQLEDVNAAKSLLEAWEARPYLDEQDQELKCPNCQSTSIYGGFRSFRSTLGWLTMVISILLVIYPFFSKTVFRCKKCGTEFNTK